LGFLIVRAVGSAVRATASGGFISASELVGGADGDFFIDGTLVDIKVNKYLEMGRYVFNQIFGYFCLSCLGGIDGCRGKVTCVAVYFARYGILHRLPVTSWILYSTTESRLTGRASTSWRTRGAHMLSTPPVAAALNHARSVGRRLDSTKELLRQGRPGRKVPACRS
jgi:hypothetical protein